MSRYRLHELERLLRQHGLERLRTESSHHIYGCSCGHRLVLTLHHGHTITTPRHVIRRALRRIGPHQHASSP
jgi:predicted RNA binding protein YcfA (HicA-like mRNA interferase family)